MQNSTLIKRNEKSIYCLIFSKPEFKGSRFRILILKWQIQCLRCLIMLPDFFPNLYLAVRRVYMMRLYLFEEYYISKPKWWLENFYLRIFGAISKSVQLNKKESERINGNSCLWTNHPKTQNVKSVNYNLWVDCV